MQLIGALTVILCCTAIGCLLCKSVKTDQRRCEEIIYVMRYIKDEIWERKTPTEAIFSSLSSVELEKCGFYEKLCQTGDLYSACKGIFNASELELIGEYSSRLGKSTAENQKNELNCVIRRFEELAYAQRERLQGKMRLCMALPVFFGLLAVIIFL
ncbi:MAG: stage III sporulation protein AB [Clostridia bacterium]|nr:stage III sporulation protein AB [Clostridia bacterium]